jgi:hypothetical protein
VDGSISGYGNELSTAMIIPLLNFIRIMAEQATVYISFSFSSLLSPLSSLVMEEMNKLSDRGSTITVSRKKGLPVNKKNHYYLFAFHRIHICSSCHHFY